MESNDIFSLGLKLAPPWKLMEQRLNTLRSPHELHLYIGADRDALYPCPECGKPCNGHDFKEMTWRHLNFFQHHCYITAPVPLSGCPVHGAKRINVPWARKGSNFTMLFEQVAMVMLSETPVFAGSSTLGLHMTILRDMLFSPSLRGNPLQNDDIFALGLDLNRPWGLMEQRLDTRKRPYELQLRIAADPDALYPCPECGRSCKARDFKEITWRHRNFFQYRCYVTAPVPRTDCPVHGVKRITIPWAGESQPLWHIIPADGHDHAAPDAVAADFRQAHGCS